ncbi:hypothetical protein IQ267_00235 [filamentous cyanobacterium LEGE 07170]|nr:hypothetical protein [filamentous cyanobacterium LEGE 07170]
MQNSIERQSGCSTGRSAMAVGCSVLEQRLFERLSVQAPLVPHQGDETFKG